MAEITKSEIIEDRTFPDGKRIITERHWDEQGVPWLFSYWGTASTDAAAVLSARVVDVVAKVDDHRTTPPPLPPEPESIIGDGPPVETNCPHGMYYLDTTTGDLYQCREREWILITNLKGPPGAPGSKGDKGDAGDQGNQGIQGDVGPQGIQGIQGIQGVSAGGLHLPLLLPTMTASAAASNLALNVFSAVGDPSYRRVVDLRFLETVQVIGRIGGTSAAATKIRIQYHPGGNINVATADAGWQPLIDSAGSHTLNTFFTSLSAAIPAGAKVENCIIRCGLFSGDGAADPTITACFLNFGV